MGILLKDLSYAGRTLLRNRGFSPITYVSITILFLGVASVAGWLPARRAARLDPSVALREE